MVFISTGARSKVTSNVRRILQSQKTFRNYLDDEEAALAHSAQTTVQRPSASTKATKQHQRSGSTPVTPRPDSSRQEKRTPAEGISRAPPPDTSEAHGRPELIIRSEHDNDPLLRSYIPSAPSERIMQALLAEPPLTYHAARAGPSITAKSDRHFCCMCGYWGKIRCKNCHLRTCGLECYKIHEDSRCGAFF